MTTDDAAKRRRVRWVQRYLSNPPAKLAAGLGLVPGYAVLETTGRRTGRRRRTVVGVRRDAAGIVWVVSEQGTHAGYVNNLVADPRVRLRLRGRWHDARAVIMPDDDARSRLEDFGRLHALTVRRLGTELVTIRIEIEDP